MFDCPGNVHPNTYDWKKEFGGLAQSTRESRIFYLEVDMSKVLGLAQYTEELEKKVEDLSVQIQGKTSEDVEELKTLLAEKTKETTALKSKVTKLENKLNK